MNQSPSPASIVALVLAIAGTVFSAPAPIPQAASTTYTDPWATESATVPFPTNGGSLGLGSGCSGQNCVPPNLPYSLLSAAPSLSASTTVASAATSTWSDPYATESASWPTDEPFGPCGFISVPWATCEEQGE